MSIPKPVVAVLLCLASPIVSAQSMTVSGADEFIRKVESCLPPPVVIRGESAVCTPLLTRMQQLHIQGVSIAVVHHGTIQWTRGYGIASPDNKPVTPETIFQAGSISKPVSAMAALRLVQEGKLSLDADVNTKLTSWKIPASDAAPGAVITLRELLSHTAGMTVHGFGGYAAGNPVPTLVQVLNGEKPANSPAVRIDTPPNTKWIYSGGGYTIMQQMLVDVTHEPFPKLLHDSVLAPIGMTHSTFDQPLPDAMKPHAAAPYDIHGVPLPEGAHTYPEMAAAGLWSTPSDLARYIIENQESLQGKANHVLSQAMTKEMMTPGKGSFGLGLSIGGQPSNPYFAHSGANAGFQNTLVAYENEGEGAVVMTNSDDGITICGEIVRAIAVAYGWPDFRPTERTLIQLPPEALTKFTGTYQAATPPAFAFTITDENGQLMGQPAHGAKEPLFPEAPTKFFLKQAPIEVEFVPNAKGEIKSLIVHQNGQEITATKTK